METCQFIGLQNNERNLAPDDLSTGHLPLGPQGDFYTPGNWQPILLTSKLGAKIATGGSVRKREFQNPCRGANGF